MSDLTEKEIQDIIDRVGLQQILDDAFISDQYLAMVLYESGYIDLLQYAEEPE